MKEKKNDEVVVEKVNKKIVTKDRVIALVIALFIGIIITSIIFCTCVRPRYNKCRCNDMTQMRENIRPNMPRRNDKHNYKYKSPNIDKNKDSNSQEETEKTTDSNN